MRRYNVSVSICLFVTLIISLFSFLLVTGEKQSKDLKSSVLRLHILANSDSKADQELKLKVRDRVLTETKDIFMSANKKEDAQKTANENIAEIISICNDEIKKNGYNYKVTAQIGKSFFPTRVYDGFVFPAGSYDAVKIKIGEAKGKNWWCVLFPQLCISSVTKETEEKFNLQESSPTLKPSLFCTEVFEKVMDKIRN